MPHTYVHFYFFAAKMKLLLPLVVWMLLTTTNVSRTLHFIKLIYVYQHLSIERFCGHFCEQRGHILATTCDYILHSVIIRWCWLRHANITYNERSFFPLFDATVFGLKQLPVFSKQKLTINCAPR